MTYEYFSQLMAIAARETGFLSGSYSRNKNIREIIASADENTIAYTCLFLEKHTHLAFAILYELVKAENLPPIPNYYAGRIPVMLECWKYWALEKKFVTTKYDASGYWVEDKSGHRGDWH